MSDYTERSRGSQNFTSHGEGMVKNINKKRRLSRYFNPSILVNEKGATLSIYTTQNLISTNI